MKKILIIQTASIGDVILATALAESIKKFDKNINIDFLVKSSCKNVLENNKSIHLVFDWNKNSRKYRNMFSVIAIIRKQKYDLIINLHRFFSSGFISILAASKKIIGYSANPCSSLFTKRFKHVVNNVHEIDRNLSLLKLSFPNAKLYKPYVNPEFFDLNLYKIKNKPFITISPGSLWNTKRLPLITWKQMISQLPDEFPVVMLGSSSDFEISNEIFIGLKQKKINLCGEISLRQSAYLMKYAKMNFANDSAPTHLASAVNAPITTVFCSTVPEFGFYPLSTNSHIVQNLEKLKCRPCGIHGHKLCPEKHFNCGNGIKVEQLMQDIKL